jgi:drug/metabolite transporter (DMT)-like permease
MVPTMSRSAAYGVLLVGVLLVSTSGPFFAVAKVDAFATVFFRMGGASILFLLWAWFRGELSQVKRAQLGRIMLGGAFLASHLMLWIKAFDLTDFASNLLLLVIQPVTAALLGGFWGEPPTRYTWISLALSLVGLMVVAGGDVSLGPRALLGDAMCLLAGVVVSLFYALTRKERRALPLAPFLGLTLGFGALFALPVALLVHAPMSGYPVTSWAWLAALVVLTTVGGHGCFNIAAKHVPLFSINVVVVLEPAISIVMGAALFGATVTRLQIVGGLILAVAVVFGLMPESKTLALEQAPAQLEPAGKR